MRTTPHFALAMLIVDFVEVVRGFRGPTIKEEGRGTRNGYEASKGSKAISGL